MPIPSIQTSIHGRRFGLGFKSELIVNDANAKLNNAVLQPKTRTRISLTAAQVRTGFATPVELVAAPGAGLALFVDRVLMSKAAGTAFGGIAAGEDITIVYSGGTLPVVNNMESTGFLDSVVDELRIARSEDGALGHDLTGNDNTAIDFELLVGDITLGSAVVFDIQYEVFGKRNEGIFLGGIFISYSHADAKFVDKLYAKLQEDGANVWLDRHDMLAGDLQKQVDRAIRLNDIVLLVLSKDSIESDWVEHELESARRKEKKEGRDVLCPVAVDDKWKGKMEDVLWRQLKKKNILDFSKWKTKAFDTPFKKLVDGLRVNYDKDGNE